MLRFKKIRQPTNRPTEKERVFTQRKGRKKRIMGRHKKKEERKSPEGWDPEKKSPTNELGQTEKGRSWAESQRASQRDPRARRGVITEGN